MLKRTILLSLVLVSLLAACEKEEPAAPPPSETAEPAPAPAEAPPPSETAAPAPAEAPPAAESAAPEPAPREAPPAAETEAQPPAETEVPAAETGVTQSGDTGKQVYEGLCVACHAAGVAGAPKFGDKAAWAPRIAQGMDTLYMHSINGFQGKTGVMPPKGGNPSLSDAEVKAAVDYMVKQVQ